MNEAELRAFMQARTRVSDGCWEWQGTVAATGYGRLKIDGRDKLAHRVAYELHYGEIPDGLTIDHLCRNRACVRPSHLEVISRGGNVLRGFGVTAEHARQTHCKHGHRFDDENTYVDSGGGRHCRTCSRETQQRYAARKRDPRKAARLKAIALLNELPLEAEINISVHGLTREQFNEASGRLEASYESYGHPDPFWAKTADLKDGVLFEYYTRERPLTDWDEVARGESLRVIPGGRA